MNRIVILLCLFTGNCQSLVKDMKYVSRKCCSNSEVLDQFGKVCVPKDDSISFINVQANGFPQCGNPTVLMELESNRNNLKTYSNRSLSGTNRETAFITDSYCVDSTPNSNLTRTYVCLEEDAWEDIPHGGSHGGSYIVNNCSEGMGHLFELDPEANSEHVYLFKPNGSIYLTHQKKLLSPDRYCVRHSKKVW